MLFIKYLNNCKVNDNTDIYKELATNLNVKIFF